MIFRKKELVLFVTILIAIVIGIIGVKFNYGYLHIKTDLDEYRLFVGKNEFSCPNTESNDCLVKLSPKNYSVLIQKNGYNDFELKTEIKRNKKSVIDYYPVIKPSFKPYGQSVNPLFVAKLSSTGDQTQYSVNGKLITTFLNSLSGQALAVISPDGFRGAVYEPKNLPELYIINVAEKSKELITLNIDFLPSEIGFFDQSTLLVKDVDTVITYDLNLNTQSNFPIVSINHIACISDAECLFISPFEIDTQVNNVNSDLNLFAEIVTEKGLDIFTTQELKYKLYLFNKETQKITFIENLPNYILNPTALILAPNKENTKVSSFIKSESGKYFEIIF